MAKKIFFKNIELIAFLESSENSEPVNTQFAYF